MQLYANDLLAIRSTVNASYHAPPHNPAHALPYGQPNEVPYARSHDPAHGLPYEKSYGDPCVGVEDVRDLQLAWLPADHLATRVRCGSDGPKAQGH